MPQKLFGQTDSHHQTQCKTSWRTRPTTAPDNTKRKGNKLSSPAFLSAAEALQPFLPELEAKYLFTQMASSRAGNTQQQQ